MYELPMPGNKLARIGTCMWISMRYSIGVALHSTTGSFNVELSGNAVLATTEALLSPLELSQPCHSPTPQASSFATSREHHTSEERAMLQRPTASVRRNELPPHMFPPDAGSRNNSHRHWHRRWPSTFSLATRRNRRYSRLWRWHLHDVWHVHSVQSVS